MLLAIVGGCALPARAGEALVAVATNFTPTAQRLQQAFEQSHAQRLTLTSGSTGKLYAQIRNGAPFDLFLAADSERPRLLEQAGLAVAGTRIAYALGTLVLWSANPNTIAASGIRTLELGQFRHLAMANPALAPYGEAAQQTLQALGLLATLKPKLVYGENVGQAYAMIASGNAELGFVAGSALHPGAGGSRWPVPATLHDPIRQDAVLLTRAADNAAAADFMQFLSSPEATVLIRAAGYRVKVDSEADSEVDPNG